MHIRRRMVCVRRPTTCQVSLARAYFYYAVDVFGAPSLTTRDHAQTVDDGHPVLSGFSHRMELGRRGWGAPQPVAGPREPGAEAGGADDGDQRHGRCDELGQAEAEQVQRTAHRDEEASQPGNRRSPGHGDAEHEIADHELNGPFTTTTGWYRIKESSTPGASLASTGASRSSR